MNTKATRLLAIGEFSTATQLSPKALRLYDEQGILRPAAIDPATNYRYYRADQVATGRLIRTLRDMDVSLSNIAEFVAVGPARGETLLRHFVRESEHRHAQQQRAFQTALSMLRHTTPSAAPSIMQQQRNAIAVAVRAYSAQRASFIERFHAESEALKQAVVQAGAVAVGEPTCSLVDPLADEDSRMELLLPVSSEKNAALSIRLLPAASCATLVAPLRNNYLADLTAALDAVFDWLDKRSCVAIEAPVAAIRGDQQGWHTEVWWAFSPGTTI